MKRLSLGCLALVLLAAPATADAAQDTGSTPPAEWFDATVEPDNEMVEGSGSGWPDGEVGPWTYYPMTEWWGQWYYAGTPDDDRWAEVWYEVWMHPQGPPGDYLPYFEVAVNWSTMDFPIKGPDGPPPGPDQEWAIQRELVYSGKVWGNGVYTSGTVKISDYNPEWVSIDVRYVDQGLGGTSPPPVRVHGNLLADCVPEPSSMILLGMGAVGLAAFAWRRRRR